MAGESKWNPAVALRDTEWSLAIKLLRARELVMQRFRPHLRQHDLTEQQWRVLRVLAETDRLEMQELSSRCCLLPPSLSRTVPKLEERGLVRREPVSTDQRRTSVWLTPKGQGLFDQVAAGSELLYTGISEQLGEQTIKDVFRVLDTLILKLDQSEMPDQGESWPELSIPSGETGEDRATSSLKPPRKSRGQTRVR